MTINTGWTSPIEAEQQARNIIARLVKVASNAREIVSRLLVAEGAITPEYIRKLDAKTRELEAAHALIMEAEANDLCRSTMDPQRLEDEAAMRGEQYISDRGDAHREAKYGKGL